MINKIYVSTSNASLVQSVQTVAIASLGYLWAMGPVEEMRTVKTISSSKWAWMVLQNGSITTTNTSPNPYSKTVKVATSLSDVTTAFAPTPPLSSPPIIPIVPSLTASFTVTSGSNIAGVGIHTFTDATSYNDYPKGTVTGSWNLGDGTVWPYNYLSGGFSHFYGTGSFTASLILTESVNHITSSAVKYITLISPTVTPTFTFSTFNLTDDSFTASFTSSVIYNGGGTIQGMWYFGDDIRVSYTNDRPFTHSYRINTYTASLSITESTFNITSSVTNYVTYSNETEHDPDPYFSKLQLT